MVLMTMCGMAYPPFQFVGTPYQNRTDNCPLGGDRYIHLTKGAYRRNNSVCILHHPAVSCQGAFLLPRYCQTIVLAFKKDVLYNKSLREPARILTKSRLFS